MVRELKGGKEETWHTMAGLFAETCNVTSLPGLWDIRWWSIVLGENDQCFFLSEE